MEDNHFNFLCISCEFKGVDFIKTCHDAGNKVFLVTAQNTKNAGWPLESIEEIFYMQEDDGRLWNAEDLKTGTAHLIRTQGIDRIVSLDDYDVSKAAMLREEFRIPGMGQTTSRYFTDKLAMRMKAAEAGIPVPAFAPLFNDQDINHFFHNVPGPWIVKPRSDAGTIGIRKILDPESFWRFSSEIGDKRFEYLVEAFKPGDVYHVDSLSVHGEILFSRASQYRNTPFEVAHGGGIFQSITVPFEHSDTNQLNSINGDVLRSFGMQSGSSHSEFIKSRDDGKFYFLETSARVGGAHLADMVEASSGINLWAEHAKIECALLRNESYTLPEINAAYAGIIQSLSRSEIPDYNLFPDLEVWWRLQKKHHVGLIVRSESRKRIVSLLDQYSETIAREFLAILPQQD